MKARNSGKWQDAVQSVARGETLLAWSQRTGTSYATARSWSVTPQFKHDVLAVQAAVLDSAVAKLNAASGECADELVSLSRNARSESTRVMAIQATWDNMIKLESHAKLRAEVAELRAAVTRLMETKTSASEPPLARPGEPESGS
jgi:hypothetical protein